MLVIDIFRQQTLNQSFERRDSSVQKNIDIKQQRGTKIQSPPITLSLPLREKE